MFDFIFAPRCDTFVTFYPSMTSPTFGGRGMNTAIRRISRSVLWQQCALPCLLFSIWMCAVNVKFLKDHKFHVFRFTITFRFQLGCRAHTTTAQYETRDACKIRRLHGWILTETPVAPPGSGFSTCLPDTVYLALLYFSLFPRIFCPTFRRSSFSRVEFQ